MKFLIGCLLITFALLQTTHAQNYDNVTSFDNCMLAYASYCPTNQLNPWDCYCCGANNAVTALSFITNAAQDLFGYVAYDSSTSRVLLVFRGTVESDIPNWILDLKSAKLIPYSLAPNGYVGEGFNDAFNDLQPQVSQAVASAMNQYPGSTLTVIGHSLGGAIAVLSAAYLAQTYSPSNMQLYTYGCPRVFDPTAATWFQNLQFSVSWRVVNDEDIVPHLPTLDMGFHHVSTEVWYQNPTEYQVCDGSGEDPNCSDSVPLPISISDHLHYFGVYESC